MARIDPDIVMFSEASNKEGALFVPRMLELCAKEGNLLWTRQFAGCRTAVQNTPYWNKRKTFRIKDRVLRTRLDVNGKQVVAYTGHLDYTHYACYLPRGYSGVTWKKLEAPVTDKAEIEKSQ